MTGEIPTACATVTGQYLQWKQCSLQLLNEHELEIFAFTKLLLNKDIPDMQC